MTGKKNAGPRQKAAERRRASSDAAHAGISGESIARFRETILTYYEENGRDLPWRHTTDPYHILVSEIMLQQTQVDRVVKKYPEFIGTFPTLRDLASAPLSAIVRAWQGMGYNRRAIALQECAKILMGHYAGHIPDKTEELEQLPGIGPATARSIAVFAFNRPVIFIETNIRRVFIHFFFEGRDDVRDQDILPLVEMALDCDNPRRWYSALMDYGTMLKKIVPNPNRRSAHYTRQSKFEGSERELRGFVIKALVHAPELEEKNLIKECGRDPGMMNRIIRALEREGFIHRKNGFIRLSAGKRPEKSRTIKK